MPTYLLPAKTPNFLRRLLLHYEMLGAQDIIAIIKHCRISVREETNWSYDGQQAGCEVVLFLPATEIAKLTLSRQSKLASQIRDDLAKAAEGITNEFFDTVRIELEDEADPAYQAAHPLSGRPPINPDALAFWKPGQIRLFISHRDNYKGQAQRLAVALEKFGISCFVAHDTIEPMEVWQHEIEKGLQTMDVMLALITEDFHGSVWTNQEVGYAKGNNIPVISLKLGGKDPEGFIADKQALKGDVENPQTSASDIYRLLSEKLGKKERLQTALIEAFLATPDWGEATIRFKLLDSLVRGLSEEEFDRIKVGYEANDQLYNAAYLSYSSRFEKFLIRTTGKKLKIVRAKILVEAKEEDEIPF